MYTHALVETEVLRPHKTTIKNEKINKRTESYTRVCSTQVLVASIQRRARAKHYGLVLDIVLIVCLGPCKLGSTGSKELQISRLVHLPPKSYQGTTRMFSATPHLRDIFRFSHRFWREALANFTTSLAERNGEEFHSALLQGGCCENILGRADCREGDEDSNFSVFRAQWFTKRPRPLQWIAFPLEILTQPLVHWMPSPFTGNPFFLFTEKCFVAPLPKNRLEYS